MDYYLATRNDFIHREMYPDRRLDYIPRGGGGSSTYKIKPKSDCLPKFTTRIEGRAVEEGARIFFEGIVDAQPKPVFKWFFNDVQISPGSEGWEDVEIYDANKMSTLIIRYVRDHHMGKYSLVAGNVRGEAISDCDLIVKRKQFPPVFWQRLYNYETTSGSRLVAAVEVGGWPVPQVAWFKDGDLLSSKTHTENYNGCPNRYVPESRLEVLQLDPMRHVVIFHRVSDLDAGLYTVRAVNALGEAVCEGEVDVEPDDGGHAPEKWIGQLAQADSDRRAKPFQDDFEPELTDEDVREMTKRVPGLPRTIEYLAGLPDYLPPPPEVLPELNFSPETIERRQGKRGGKPPSPPSKFIKADYVHTGYSCDDDVFRIVPMWSDPRDDEVREAVTRMKYSRVTTLPVAPRRQPPPSRSSSPPGPHAWETHEQVDDLYKLLDAIGGGSRLTVTASKQSTSSLMMCLEEKQKVVAPALPPKTKIMNSPSRHLFSSPDVVDHVIPVKEKIKLIARQQEEILKREEAEGRHELAGGVRLLPPPSPTLDNVRSSSHSSTVNVVSSQFASTRSEVMTRGVALIPCLEDKFDDREPIFLSTEEQSSIVTSRSVAQQTSATANVETMMAIDEEEEEVTESLTATEMPLDPEQRRSSWRKKGDRRYRTPPSTPFQPSFYKAPITNDNMDVHSDQEEEEV